jgi:O-antigen/teichoic acid export membrane protein
MKRLRQAWDDLGRDSLTYLLGEGASKGFVYLLLVLLARYLGAADFGSVNLFIALTGPLALVTGLGLPDALGRFYFGDEPFDRVVTSALALLGTGAVAVSLLLLALRGSTESLLEIPLLLTPLVVLCAPAIAVRSAWLAVLRAEGRSGAFATARLAEPIVSLALVLGLVALSGTLQLREVLLAYLGGILAVALVGLVRLLRRAGDRVSRRLSRELLAFSLPLVFHALAMTGLASFDQIILNQILGLEATGVYAFAYRIGMAMFLVSFGVAAAWGPFVLRRLAGTERELSRLLRLLCAVEVVVGIVLMALLPSFARFMGGTAYGESVALIPIVVCGYVWMALYALATPFLAFNNRTLALARYSATALAANIALNYLLIPHFGPLAAALTTLASYALLFALAWNRVARDFPGLPVAELTTAGLLTVPPALGMWWLLS